MTKKDKRLKKRCWLCREWVSIGKRYVYHMASMTDWKPKEGLEPRLREFQCGACKGKFYVALSVADLKEIGVIKYL